MGNAAVADYAGYSPNDFPMYGVRAGAHCLKIADATLRSWFVGANRGTFPPVLEPAAVNPLTLSFNNLAEAFVLRSLLTEHNVQLSVVREAIDAAERQLGIKRLLLRQDLKAYAGKLLIEKLGEYLTLARSQQYAMKQMLDAVLERFVWEDPAFPSMLYPYVPAPRFGDRKIIAIHPRKSFGSPYIERIGVTTSVISKRMNAGESVADLVADYRISEEEVDAAILYEEARAAA